MKYILKCILVLNERPKHHRIKETVSRRERGKQVFDGNGDGYFLLIGWMRMFDWCSDDCKLLIAWDTVVLPSTFTLRESMAMSDETARMVVRTFFQI